MFSFIPVQIHVIIDKSRNRVITAKSTNCVILDTSTKHAIIGKSRCYVIDDKNTNHVITDTALI